MREYSTASNDMFSLGAKALSTQLINCLAELTSSRELDAMEQSLVKTLGEMVHADVKLIKLLDRLGNFRPVELVVLRHQEKGEVIKTLGHRQLQGQELDTLKGDLDALVKNGGLLVKEGLTVCPLYLKNKIYSIG